MENAYSQIPVQILINKVIKRDNNTLPAVLTTEKLLCSLIPDYNLYNRRVKLQLINDKKRNQSNKKSNTFKRKYKFKNRTSSIK